MGLRTPNHGATLNRRTFLGFVSALVGAWIGKKATLAVAEPAIASVPHFVMKMPKGAMCMWVPMNVQIEDEDLA